MEGFPQKINVYSFIVCVIVYSLTTPFTNSSSSQNQLKIEYQLLDKIADMQNRFVF
jgi:hypothetical protein